MPPEYAQDGYFSVKSDVFSFGVLLLEIISGKKNNASYCLDRLLNLVGYVSPRLYFETCIINIMINIAVS